MKFAVLCHTPKQCDELRSALWERRPQPYEYYLILDSWSFQIDPGDEDQWLVQILEEYQDRIECVFPDLKGKNPKCACGHAMEEHCVPKEEEWTLTCAHCHCKEFELCSVY